MNSYDGRMDDTHAFDDNPPLPLVAALKAAAVWGWGDSFSMPLFSPGTRVRLSGAWETVSHVALRRQELAIYLVGHDLPVDPARLELASTTFTTLRVPEAR